MQTTCNRCVLDSREAALTFTNGVCQYCTVWIRKEVERRLESTNLPWVYDRIRKDGIGKQYDVLLGLSGGVDSSLCLHYLIENGIRPLCFSVDNGYNDPKADENVMRLVEGLKVPFFRYVLDLDSFKELQASFIASGTKNLEIPTDHVLMAATYEVARKYGIKTVISGGNHATEGIMPPDYGYDAKDLTFIRSVHKAHGSGNLSKLPTIGLLSYLKARFIEGIQVVNLLDYYTYDRAEAIKLLSEKYGWKDYGEKHCENVFTAWFQNWYLPVKWGMDKRRPHYSSLINSGQMTRKEAMELLLKRPEYPELGIERKVLTYPKRSHDDYRTGEKLWLSLSKAYGVLKGKN